MARVSINVASESLLQDLLAAMPSTIIMVEIPAFMAGEPVNTAAIATLLLVVPVPLAAAHQAGAVLVFAAALNVAHALR